MSSPATPPPAETLVAEPRLDLGGALNRRGFAWAIFEWARNPYYIPVIIYLFAPYFAGIIGANLIASGAVDGACEFTQAMLPALRRAVEHPDMTEELAEILSTRVVNVEYRVETGVSVR